MNNKMLFGVATLLSLSLLSPVSEAGGLFRKKDPAEKEQAAADEQKKSQRWEAAFIKRNIVPGKTSMDQIKGIWGNPDSVDHGGGDGAEVWWFYREQSGARGALSKLRRAAGPFTGAVPRAIRGTDNAVDTVEQGRDVKRDVSNEAAIISTIILFFDDKGIVSELDFNQ